MPNQVIFTKKTQFESKLLEKCGLFADCLSYVPSSNSLVSGHKLGFNQNFIYEAMLALSLFKRKIFLNERRTKDDEIQA